MNANSSDQRPIPVISPHNERVIREYLRTQKPFFVEGGPGIGKSLIVETLAKAECGKDKVEKIDITEDTEVRHLVGEYDLVGYFAAAQQAKGAPLELSKTFFRAGKLTKAANEGLVLIIEELDRAGRETLFPVLFDAIEYKRVFVPDTGQTIDGSNNGFNIVITVNRFTDIGTVSLPKALLRRPRCVRCYDPSKELDINRWQAIQFEARIIMANLERLFATQPLGKLKAQRLVTSLLAKVIFPLRAAKTMDEEPSPAETAMWFVDMLQCEGQQLLSDQATSRDRLEICLRYRGALAKTSDDDGRVVEAFRHYFENLLNS